MFAIGLDELRISESVSNDCLSKEVLQAGARSRPRASSFLALIIVIRAVILQACLNDFVDQNDNLFDCNGL